MNIFLSDNSEFPRVKIGDFGFACKLRQGESIINKCGTVSFMAPEAIKKESSNFKRDIWSIGVVLYALLSAGTPFFGPSERKLKDAIIN